MLGGRPPLARLHILGGVRLAGADGRPATPRSAKGRAILAYLALAPGGGADRGRLAGLVWGDGADAKASLRQCVRELRRTLAEAGLDVLLLADPQRVALDLRRVWVDALEVRRLAGSAEPADQAALAALYAGDLLETAELHDPAFEDWLTTERERLRRQVCGALEGGLRRSLDGEPRDLARAEQAARALLAVDPAHEAAHRALMRLHALTGDVPAAVRQHQACREALARRLDLEPSAETEALLREIRGGALGRREEPPIRQPLVARVVAARGRPHASVTVVEGSPPLGTGDPADAAVAAALAAGLREALARKRWLSLVDPGPARLLRPDEPDPLDPRQPDYLVSVALLRGRERMRFSVRLQEGASTRILWADHYDRGLAEDVFEIVDDLAGALARRLDRELELAEITRAARVPVERLSAYDCVLRAIPLVFKLTPDSFAEADRMLRAAQEADPHDALVYTWRAFWYAMNIGQDWVRDLATAREELGFLVRRAIELDPKNGHALAVAGHIASFVRHDYAQGTDLIEQASRLDPGSVYATDFRAVTLCYTGDARAALRELEASREQWERHPAPFYVQTTACIAYFLAGQHEQAVALARRTVAENPNFEAPYRPLIAGLGLLGEVDEASRHLAALKQLQPDFSISWFRACYPPLREEDQSRYVKGLRKAGVEE